MYAVVNEQGTGRRARIPGIGVAGKTGSAQVVSRARQPKGEELPRHLRAHGWFVAYAPAEEPEIALAVLVEHSGSGGAGAAVARRILVRYLALRRGGVALASAEGVAEEEDDGD